MTYDVADDNDLYPQTALPQLFLRLYAQRLSALQVTTTGSTEQGNSPRRVVVADRPADIRRVLATVSAW